ncbi:hypothetical protein JIG36_42555 [Actinoplanes sp. LDG1-06]|uniref:Uncharacterized protein n=1 Tax=Paractinoplanes ovalisporus TaxID=2810368 RepID=A0ABS2ASL6_9ACTN|nr:hypothetical protein [Actinoplanes ovalisporus]MBM2622206.1 hypothetical protein [Actinoplanes ovalisporus]
MTTEQRDQDQQEQNEPNEFGFGGGATAPEPAKEPPEGYGESVAVPAGDLTGAITGAIDEVTEGRHRDQDDDEGAS